jgi:hypothetical protein
MLLNKWMRKLFKVYPIPCDEADAEKNECKLHQSCGINADDAALS